MRNREIDNSWGFNFSRFNSNGWSNLHLPDASRDFSVLAPSIINSPTVNHLNLPHDPIIISQQPEIALFQCLQNCPSDEDIKEVSYLMDNQAETKKVNHKQYFRIMKRRIKKVLTKLNANKDQEDCYQEKQGQKVIENKKNYKYESRHLHAKSRKRGADGKFIATRSQQDRFREKKKRGRKPKNITLSPQQVKGSQKFVNLSSTTHKQLSDKLPVQM